MDAPPLHERTFSRTLPHKRGWYRAVIGMGLTHHCLSAHLHCDILPVIRQYPKRGGQSLVCPRFWSWWR